MNTNLIHYVFIKVILSITSLVFLSFSPHLFSRQVVGPEICDNALDDDGDGLIDLNDPDCECKIIEPTSLIPNPSFEDMNCCPDRQSQLDCAGTWIQASEATTDYIHMCGWMGWDDFPPPVPFPDGEGIVGFRDGRVRGDNTPEVNWKEYAGACLLSPLKKNIAYKFEFYVGFVNRFISPDINITFFGTTDCANLPFGVGDDAFGCPTNGPGWVRLGSSFVSGGAGHKWVKTSIDVIPQENITAIAIGPDCPAVNSAVSIYYFLDNLTLADLRSFQFKITEESFPCEEDFHLKVPSEPGYTYQWYKEGIALIGETSPETSKVYGEGNYQVRIMDGMSCSLSGIYNYTLPVVSDTVVTTICDGDVYHLGDRSLNASGHYEDTLKTNHNCDSIVSLDLHVLGILADTVQAKIFEGESYAIDAYHFDTKGDHLIHLISSHGCDSLVLLQLDYYHVYFPNVFSPNDDGINDVFTILGGDDLLGVTELVVYDRWGGQIFSGKQWDGKHEGTLVNPGVYTYVVRIKMNDGIERSYSESVTLIR